MHLEVALKVIGPTQVREPLATCEIKESNGPTKCHTRPFKTKPRIHTCTPAIGITGDPAKNKTSTCVGHCPGC